MRKAKPAGGWQRKRKLFVEFFAAEEKLKESSRLYASWMSTCSPLGKQLESLREEKARAGISTFIVHPMLRSASGESLTVQALQVTSGPWTAVRHAEFHQCCRRVEMLEHQSLKP